MLKDITIGQYFPGNTIVHRMDPRVKILIVLLFILTLFMINSFYPYLLIVLFLIFSIKLTEIPLKIILRGIKPIIPIILITFTINVLFTKGEIIAKLGPIVISKEGLKQASFMAARLIFLILGSSLLTLTTSPISLTDGIEKLLNPFRKIGVPAHELAMMMTIALRFIPDLLEETDKIMKAQMARGADFESGNILRRAKNLIPLLVPLFINSLRRSEELAFAMDARCYRGGDNRTRLHELKLRQKDIIILIVTIAFFALIVSTRYINYFGFLRG